MMISFIKRFWPIIFFTIACLIYYWKVFFKDYVPFPGDLMVGAYMPWLEYKWGFPTGVPVKNPLISDIFSQFFMWKSLVSESWKNLTIPLWNPYSYSGYPLLANFHSGAFYPLNIIHLILGDIKGWNFLVIFPAIGSGLTIYLYLIKIGANKLGGVVGGIVYAYSGFAISWAQFVTAAQAMVWMPLVLLVIEKYFDNKRNWILYWLPIIFFLLVTSGHFQIMIYMFVLTLIYFFWKWLDKREIKLIVGCIIPAFLSIGILAFQILPTLELTKYGLRFEENYIVSYNYGLLPIKYLATLLAPDIFGNAATGNFFGAFNYHEAIIYCGILPIICFVLGLFIFKSNRYIRFYTLLAIVALLLGLDTFVGRAIYIYNVPGLSTSAAGRIAVIFSLSMAVLTALVMTNIKKLSFKKIIFSLGVILFCYLVIVYLAKFVQEILINQSDSIDLLLTRRAVSLRNLILPGGLIVIYSFLFVLTKISKIGSWLLLIVISLEMFRFGWKYIPFVPQRIVYPDTPITKFLEEKSKNEIFRIDRERAEIMPPATWMQYRLMSPSGYDPMAIKDYVSVYQEEINGNESGKVSRYSELERYDSKALGKFNVKYLLVIKRDEYGKIGGDGITQSVDLDRWKKVFETEGSAILENLDYLPRARYLESENGMVTIKSYTPNKIVIQFQDGKDKTLLLADTWFPGWMATLNGKLLKITKCEGIFRCINLDSQSGEVIFEYRPETFWLGVKISLLCLSLNILFLLKRLFK